MVSEEEMIGPKFDQISILVEYLCSKYMERYCTEHSRRKIIELQRSSSEEGITKEEYHEIYQDILSELIVQIQDSFADLTPNTLFTSWEGIDENTQKEWFYLLSDIVIVLSSENFDFPRFSAGESPTYNKSTSIILYYFSIALSHLIVSKPINDYLVRKNHEYDNLFDFHKMTISSFKEYLEEKKIEYRGLSITLEDPYQSIYFLTIGHYLAVFSESEFGISKQQPISIQDQVLGAEGNYVSRFTSGEKRSLLPQLFFEGEDPGLRLSILNSILYRRISSISNYQVLVDPRTSIFISTLIKMGWEIIEDRKPQYDENEADYIWGFAWGWNITNRFYELVLISAPLINDNFRDLMLAIKKLESRLPEYGYLSRYPKSKLLCHMVQHLAYLCQGNVGIQAYSEKTQDAALQTLEGFMEPHFDFLASHKNHFHPLFWFLVCARQVRDNTMNWISKIDEKKGLGVVKRHPRGNTGQEVNYIIDNNYLAARVRHVSFYNQIGIPTKIRSEGRGRWIQTMFDHPNKKKKHQLKAEIDNIPKSLESSISSLQRLNNILKQPLTMLVILDHYIQLTRLMVTSVEIDSSKDAIEELNKIIEQQSLRFSKQSHRTFSGICEEMVEFWYDDEGNMDESNKKTAVRAQRNLRNYWGVFDENGELESIEMSIKIPNFSFQGAFRKTERDIFQLTDKLSESIIFSLSEKEYKKYAEQTMGKGTY